MEMPIEADRRKAFDQFADKSLYLMRQAGARGINEPNLTNAMPSHKIDGVDQV